MTAAPFTLACLVKRVIGDELGLAPDMIARSDRLCDLGVNDVQKIHIGMSIEDLVDAEASDADQEACQTVGDLIDLAERLSAGLAVAA